MPLTPMPADELMKLQLLLRSHGFSLGTTGLRSDGIDGDWGPSTAEAFNQFMGNVEGQLPNLPSSEPVGPKPLPDVYDWLKHLPKDSLPRTIYFALKELGVHETAGGANSPTIMAWAKETGLQAVYTADSIPWCGLFAALVCTRAGKPVPDGPLWALNWAKFGVDVGQPGLGDVLTFTREGGGHVGFYVGEDSSAFHVLGGNTSDQVKIARIDKKRLYRARRPVYKILPASVRPYVLAPNGGLSQNEA